MFETYDPEIIKAFYAGQASDSYVMMKLMVQVIAILFAGLLLWRMAVIFSSKKNQKSRESLMDSSRFQKQWRKR